MKRYRERPSVWHVIVPLSAMLYLYCVDRALAGAEHSAGNAFTYNDPTVCRLTVVLGLLEAFAWLFLLADLIRQISLFFGIRFK